MVVVVLKRSRVGEGGMTVKGTPKIYRVKCDLQFIDSKVALAFSKIVHSFEVSTVKFDKRKNGGNSHGST